MRAGTTHYGNRPSNAHHDRPGFGRLPCARLDARSDELLFWSDIYASKQGAQRAAYHLKAHAGNSAVEDMTAAEVTA